MTQAARRMTQQAELELRGVQEPALHAIQHGESPIVAVMPTGYQSRPARAMLEVLQDVAAQWQAHGRTFASVAPSRAA